jgi:hypothetical protein
VSPAQTVSPAQSRWRSSVAGSGDAADAADGEVEQDRGGDEDARPAHAGSFRDDSTGNVARIVVSTRAVTSSGVSPAASARDQFKLRVVAPAITQPNYADDPEKRV